MSMSLEHFQAIMNPLLEKGRRAYTPSVLDLVFTEVRNLHLDDFKRLVTHLNGAMRAAPMVPDFKKGIAELGLRPRAGLRVVSQDGPRPVVREDFLYWVQDNVWANNDYIFVRGSRPSFIIKANHPDHPLVMADAEVRGARLKQVKSAIAANTYNKLVESWGGTPRAHRPLSFDVGPA